MTCTYQRGQLYINGFLQGTRSVIYHYTMKKHTLKNIYTVINLQICQNMYIYIHIIGHM